VTTRDPEIVQTAGNLHDQIRTPGCGQAEDIFDSSTPFDPGNDVFYDYACTGDEMIQELLPRAQGPTFRLFLGCAVRMPAGS